MLGVLFDIVMIPLLGKLNCLPTKGTIRSYQIKADKNLTKEGTPVYRNIASAYADDIISVIDLDLTKDNPKAIVDEILDMSNSVRY